ncbi:phosphotransferase [Amnibacterium kyonggiense]
MSESPPQPETQGGDAIDESAAWGRSFYALPAGEHPARIVKRLAGGIEPRLAWRNELGGQTWELGDRYLKWSPRSAGIDLTREALRLHWLSDQHPVPRLLDEGSDDDGQWLLTTAINADSAVSDRWRDQPERAVRAIADGLRLLHALPISGPPSAWESWVTRSPAELGARPMVHDPVLVHGDACSPNTLLGADGLFAANVDLGDAAVGDRWADLAVAAMSLEWNFGPGWDPYFFDAYGIDPDPTRIAYYQALYRAES